MIVKGFIVATLFVGLSLILLGSARALELNISGNAANSQNQINLQGGQSTNIDQNNQGSFNNTIDASANTGGNSVSGGNGGSITTGNASTNVNVSNQFNSNQANVTCCPSKTPTPTPDPGKPKPSATPTPLGFQPTSTPTPTPPGGVGGPPSGGGNNGNGGGNGGAGGAGGPAGQVMGLSAASGEGTLETILTTSGIVCLLASTYFLRKKSVLA